MKDRSSIKGIVSGTARAAYLIAALMMLASCGSGPDKYTLRDEAIAAYEAGDYETALAGFNEALDASWGEVSDFTYDILRYRAECELRTGDIAAARASYEALGTIDKDAGYEEHYGEILSELSLIDTLSEANDLFNEGRYDEALAVYKECADLTGGAPGRVAWFNLAVCYEYTGDFEEAAYLLGQYVDAYPDDEAAQRELKFTKSR